MKISELVDNWPKLIALIALTVILLFGHGCPSQVDSLRTPGKKIGRAELQIELDSIIATAEYRLASLDRQDQFRDIIFKNALLMVEGGGMNPIGIMTLLASLYGIARGGQDIAKKVKKKRESS